MSALKPLRLLLLGAPGSGKGTVTSKLLKVYPDIQSISSGDLLRRQIAQKTHIGLEALKYTSQGALVPDSVITKLIVNDLKENIIDQKVQHWLLDGFPRRVSQAQDLDAALKLDGEKSVFNLVVEIDVPQSVIVERITNRRVHVPSGRVYNLQYKPPKVPGKDDVTGEALVQRLDDTEAIVTKRLNDYNDLVTPLKQYYRDLGILKTVSGDTSDIVFPKLLNVIQNRA